MYRLIDYRFSPLRKRLRHQASTAGHLKGMDEMTQPTSKDVCVERLEQAYRDRRNSLTVDRVVHTIKACADVMEDRDYLGAAMELRLVADWVSRQFTPADATAVVKGLIVGSLASGHIDGRDGAGYCKSLLANIADVLGIPLSDEVKAANGLH